MNLTYDIDRDWFYIQHKSTGRVVASACEDHNDHARSQVVVIRPQNTSNELWCWDENSLKNKATGLVLDIRKGKLHLIKDTDICLYYKKPSKEAHNQLWAIRSAAGAKELEHPLQQNNVGIVIYSVCNRDWVFDICCPEDSNTNNEERQKLILFPYQSASQTQIWDLIPENDAHINQYTVLEEPNLIFDDSSLESSMTDDYDQRSYSSSFSCESIQFPHGLSPAKRSSQTSITLTSRKESIEDISL